MSLIVVLCENFLPEISLSFDFFLGIFGLIVLMSLIVVLSE